MACEAAATKDPAFSGHLDSVIRHREPYVEAVFRELLAPLVPPQSFREQGDGDFPLQFEQIEDERIPAFSYVAVDDPRAITEGDWVRLAALDDGGDSFTWPYSPEFLGPNPVANFAYDRFWHPTGEKPAQTDQTTRWLCAGYSFVGVGKDDSQSGFPFFTHPQTGGLAHFRHHYFALGLIAHFQRASLLRFKHDLAEAAGSSQPLPSNPEEDSGELDEFRDRTERLTHNFLRFRTVYWFSEVSNQIQGRELFDLFGKHLRLKELFAEVAADIDFAGAVLRQHEEEQQSRTQEHLTILGAVILVLPPILSFAEGKVPKEWKPYWPVGVAVTFALLIVLIVGTEPFRRLVKHIPRRREFRWLSVYKCVFSLSLLLAVIGALLRYPPER